MTAEGERLRLTCEAFCGDYLLEIRFTILEGDERVTSPT